jgi:threonine dehydrogenase-like Zn-dependent dehydrogenase
MRIMNHGPTPADARVLVVGTGRMGLATTRQELAAGAGEVLSGYSPHRLAAAPSGTPVAVAGEVFARLRDGGGPATPLSGSGSGVRVHPGNRRPAGGELLGRPA